MTELVLDLFRVSSRMTTAGDRLVASFGLTSARWQILGSMIAAGRAQPVAWLARDMGASRQNLQRIIYELEKGGLVTIRPNPHHRRAHLVELTTKGRSAFDEAMKLQAPWADSLAEGLSHEEISIARKVVTTLRERLEASEGRDPSAPGSALRRADINLGRSTTTATSPDGVITRCAVFFTKRRRSF